MDPVPYEIREEDIDEVLSAYEPTGGGGWSEDERVNVRAHVMRHVNELNETVRTAPEDAGTGDRRTSALAEPIGSRPGAASDARRELALAAIEDMLIRDGLIDVRGDESRVFPVVPDERRTR